MKSFFLTAAFLTLLCAASAAAEPPAVPFLLPGVSQSGIFDASIAATPASERAWLSYSAVDPSKAAPQKNPRIVTTRLAYSDDGGAAWKDLGVAINAATSVDTGKAIDWNNETSSLLYDADAPAGERWKLFWHHYPTIDGAQKFEHGWIAYKAAASPERLASSPEVKLFSAAAYDAVNDDRKGWTFSPIPSEPLINADKLATALKGCVAFTEPATLSTPQALYLALSCAETHTAPAVVTMKTVLLACKKPCHTSNPAAWAYVSTLLTSDDAFLLGYRGFTAPDLYAKNGRTYLMISPTLDRPVKDAYQGCLVMRFADLASGTLDRADTPTSFAQITGTRNSFNGACTYQASLPAAGVIYGEIENIETQPTFKLFSKVSNLP